MQYSSCIYANLHWVESLAIIIVHCHRSLCDLPNNRPVSNFSLIPSWNTDICCAACPTLGNTLLWLDSYGVTSSCSCSQCPFASWIYPQISSQSSIPNRYIWYVRTIADSVQMVVLLIMLCLSSEGILLIVDSSPIGLYYCC